LRAAVLETVELPGPHRSKADLTRDAQRPNRRLLPADELAKIDEIEAGSNMRRRRSPRQQEIQAHLARRAGVCRAGRAAEQSENRGLAEQGSGRHTIVMLPERKTDVHEPPREGR